ncbi:MAG: hypothetical protein WA705_15715 [Candidatus Ozemobacteraceae bacterium]
MKRVMLFLVLLMSVLFLSNKGFLAISDSGNTTGYLFDFFGTLCLLALLDVNVPNVFAVLKKVLGWLLIGSGSHVHPHSTAHLRPL